jgi:hypothetical protein
MQLTSADAAMANTPRLESRKPCCPPPLPTSSRSELPLRTGPQTERVMWHCAKFAMPFTRRPPPLAANPLHQRERTVTRALPGFAGLTRRDPPTHCERTDSGWTLRVDGSLLEGANVSSQRETLAESSSFGPSRSSHETPALARLRHYFSVRVSVFCVSIGSRFFSSRGSSKSSGPSTRRSTRSPRSSPSTISGTSSMRTRP